jgi:tetratricopeptide (TPR) repeat protein
MSVDEQRLQRERAQASLMRGIGYARQGQWQQAVRALTGALEELPDHLEAHYQLAACQAQLGNAREARRLIQRALAMEGLVDAERLRFLRLLGKLGIQVGDYVLAADCFEEALEMTGEVGGPILDQLAQVMCKSGNYGRGISLYLRAAQARRPGTT